MINFAEELAKYQPSLEVDDVENSINSTEIQDLLDVLQHLSRQVKSIDKE